MDSRVIQNAIGKIKNVANSLFGDTNPNQAGNQNFVTNTASKVGKFIQNDFNRAPAVQAVNNIRKYAPSAADTFMNKKFLPGQVNTFGQIGRNVLSDPSKYILSSAMTKPNFTGINAIDRNIAKPTGHALNSLINTSTLGLVSPPEQQATTIQDRIGQGVGFGVGLLNPYSLGQKALAPVGLLGERAAIKLIPRLRVAPGMVQNIAKGVGGEVAQSLGYVGAKKALGQDISFKDDLTMGLGMRGGLRVIGKGLKGYSPKSFDVHPDDLAVMDDFIRRVRGGGANSNLGRSGKDAQRLAEHYVGKSAKDLSNKKLAQVFESLINNAEGQPTKFPALGLVGKKNVAEQPIPDISAEAFKTKGKIKVTNIPTQTAIKNRAEIKAGNPDLYDQRTAKWDNLDGNKEPLPWETNAGINKLATSKTQMQPQVTEIQKRVQTPRDLLNKKMQGVSGQPMSQQQGIGGSQSKQALPNQGAQGQKPVRSSFDDIVDKADIDVKKKVHLFNYLDTPEFVLEKVGLKSYADDLVKADDIYAKNLKSEINRVSEWAKQAPSKESSQRIFRWLDGDQSTPLDPTEKRIAGEVKTYLKEWADKLALPEDKRIASYITHIFDKDFIQKEFDPDLAKLLDENVSKSVYDPFLQKRLGKLGYKEDVWQALDAYVKRATRKEAFDPVLEGLSNRAQNLDLETYKYIQKYVSSINMKPTDVENLLDNFIKQSPVGYSFGQRPTINLTTKLRTSVFRGALGLNVGSAVRNLSQWGNTYAKLGEKHTFLGYTKLFTKMAGRNLDELYDQNVLGDNIVQDRTLSATKQWLQKADKGLFVFFDLAEKINRGSAYFGAKSKALSQGLDEAKAIEYAKKIVRETQFDYSRVGTPVALRGTIGKTVAQFMTYPIKQKEFLGRMISKKEYAGILRYTAASLITMGTFGKLIGMKPTEFIPFAEYFTGEGRFETPAIQLGKGALGMVSTDPDTREEAKKNFWKNAALTFPAGVQIKKTIEGLQATDRGYGQSPSGRVRYPLPQDPASRAKGALFGQYPFKEAQNYFKGVKNKTSTPLGEKQSEQFKNQSGEDRLNYYNSVHDAREKNREAKGKLESGMFGLDIPNPFAKKEEPKKEISDVIMWTDQNGRSTTVNLSPKANTAPSGTLASYQEGEDNTSKAIKIWKAPVDQVSNEKKIEAYKSLGFEPDDVRYAYKASFDTDTKVKYIASKNLEHDKLIDELIKGRNESVGGKRFAADGVLDELYKQNLISSAERTALKKIKTDSKGKGQAGGGGSGKGLKVKKAKKPKFTRRSVPKLRAAKPKKLKTKRVKLAQIKLDSPRGAENAGKVKLKI